MQVNYIVYVDVLAILVLANFFCDYLLLWATAAVTRTVTTWRRLLVGALIGTLHFLLLYLANLRIIPYYGVLRFLPTILAIAISMLLVAFYPLNIRRLSRLLLHFLGIGFSSGGAGLAAAYLLGNPTDPNEILGFLVAIATILIVAEVGWGVVQNRMWRQVYQIPLCIYFDNMQVRVTGLMDTGNRLRDPLNGLPVIVLEHGVLSRLLPARLARALVHMETGDLSAVSQLTASSTWSARFRIIPYSSLGRKNGLLIGFRPDKILLEIHGKKVEVPSAIVGICDHQLDPEGDYRALIPPAILQTALRSVAKTTTVAPAAMGGQSQ